MFLAKFKQVDSDVFTSDKNGNMPYMGEVLAGKAQGTIYNGTMFIRDGLEVNKLYLCDNFIDEKVPDLMQTRIISLVSLIEVKELRDQLGKAEIVIPAKE